MLLLVRRSIGGRPLQKTLQEATEIELEMEFPERLQWRSLSQVPAHPLAVHRCPFAPNAPYALPNSSKNTRTGGTSADVGKKCNLSSAHFAFARRAKSPFRRAQILRPAPRPRQFALLARTGLRTSAHLPQARRSHQSPMRGRLARSTVTCSDVHRPGKKPRMPPR